MIKRRRLLLYLGFMILAIATLATAKYKGALPERVDPLDGGKKVGGLFYEQPLFHMKGEKPYRYKLAACALFQDEETHLVEWIEFHKLVGVEHFYLYNNLSGDLSCELLAPYIQRGEVDVIDWPYEALTVSEWDQIRKGAFNHALTKGRGQAKWLAFLDMDDYLFPSKKENVVSVLSSYEELAAIAVNRLHFGVEKNRRKLIHCEENRVFQPVVRPERVVGFTAQNSVICIPGYQQTTLSAIPFKGAKAPDVVADPLRINHYFCRNIDFLVTKKGGDPVKTVNILKEARHVEDKSIERFAKKLRQAHPFP